MVSRAQPVVVVGAGLGGLAAALLLAARGRPVTLLERAGAPGGKVRRVAAGGAAVCAGPDLLTQPEVFEAIFAAAGARLADHVALRRQALAGRHLWADGARLDLPADPAAATEAIGAFAGAAAARGHRAFLDQARRIHDALEGPYLAAARPGTVQLAAGAARLGRFPFRSLWDALGGFFADPRLRQVFARLAGYVGASPLQAPATLMLIAHVEARGTFAVEGGLDRLAAAMAALAEARGATLRRGAPVAEVLVRGGRASGVRLADGEVLPAAAVVMAADAAALAGGRFGAAAARALDPLPAERRSASAVAWAMRAEVAGAAPARQTVAHAADPVAEHADVFYRGRLPAAPSVALWAEDRAEGAAPPAGPERLLALVPAPARADRRATPPEALAACAEAAFGLLARCGIEVRRRPDATTTLGPDEWEALHPGSGGALYGAAMHGWQAAFARPGIATRLPGLFLAGGGAHPGPGVAMAALSGRHAAAAVLADRP